MTGRLVAALIALLVLMPLTAGLLFKEEFVTKKEASAGPAAAIDPLSVLVYTPSSRDTNVKKMGFDDAQTTKVLGYMESFAKRLNLGAENDTIDALLARADDSTVLEDALCGRLTPSRYGALQLLVKEDQGELRVLDLAGIPGLDPQDWYDKDRPARLATEIDAIAGRQDDATRMAFGAVFARKVDAALKHESPWGQSIFAGWSWTSLAKQWPAVEDKVERYVATLHLLLENVTADGGFCRTG